MTWNLYPGIEPGLMKKNKCSNRCVEKTGLYVPPGCQAAILPVLVQAANHHDHFALYVYVTCRGIDGRHRRIGRLETHVVPFQVESL
jgi:hypothetical protein